MKLWLLTSKHKVIAGGRACWDTWGAAAEQWGGRWSAVSDSLQTALVPPSCQSHHENCVQGKGVFLCTFIINVFWTWMWKKNVILSSSGSGFISRTASYFPASYSWGCCCWPHRWIAFFLFSFRQRWLSSFFFFFPPSYFLFPFLSCLSFFFLFFRFFMSKFLSHTNTLDALL